MLVHGEVPTHIVDALRETSANKLVKKVVVLSESNAEQLKTEIEKVVPKILPKLTIREFSKRPTFRNLVELANLEADAVDDSIVAISNADIAFASEDDCTRVIDAFLKFDSTNQVAVCLTRMDLIDGVPKRMLVDTLALPNMLSADMWLFNKPISLEGTLSYSTGQMFCDKFFNHDIVVSNYELFNLCVDVEIVHYEADVKTLEYYQEQSSMKNSRLAINKHWGESVDPAIGYYEIPPISSEVFNTGYRPRPLPANDREQRFYVTMKCGVLNEDDLIRVVSLLVLLTECFDRPIIFVVHSAFDQRRILQVLALIHNDRTVVLLQEKPELLSFFLLGGKNRGKGDVICLNSLEAVNSKFLKRFKTVLFCLDFDNPTINASVVDRSFSNAILRLIVPEKRRSLMSSDLDDAKTKVRIFSLSDYDLSLRGYLSRKLLSERRFIVARFESLLSPLYSEFRLFQGKVSAAEKLNWKD